VGFLLIEDKISAPIKEDTDGVIVLLDGLGHWDV
jgi:hypothetical protein